MKRPLGGLTPWLLQRLSAVLMLGFLVFVLLQFLFNPPHSYDDWRGWVRHPGVGIAALLFFAALLAHAWVGLRDVTLDYIKPLGARIAVLALMALALLMAGAWFFRLIWLARV